VSSFREIETGPAGGSVWQGVIPNPFVPGARRASVVYLPPGATGAERYPVVFLLHGLPGSPYSYVYGLRFAETADALVAADAVPPFVAVAPAAGAGDRFHGEWTGVWERFVVHAVVPWVDANLPVLPGRRDRSIAGLSAGGYGAVDIGLRHPRLFGTLEAWSGYFAPIRDGSLRHARPEVLAAHDPTRLIARGARRLRRLGMRFFVSCGTTHDRVNASFARAFAARLRSLRLPHRLWLAPGAHDGKLWRAQLPAALEYALSRPARGSLRPGTSARRPEAALRSPPRGR
jgi:enterochelin esterase-like enzyme